jgi:hypothetical protein
VLICPECAALSEEYWDIFAKIRGVEDEIKLTNKTDSNFTVLRDELHRLVGLSKDVRQRSAGHQQSHRGSEATSSEAHA